MTAKVPPDPTTILITYLSEKQEVLVSHGVRISDENTVILPNEPPTWLGARWSHEYNEWVL